MLTGEFEIEPSSVNEASAQSFSHAHFQELFSNIMKTEQKVIPKMRLMH
jgi:hypothetical protein